MIVTGCYDWFHSGHVRFFEEVSQIGQLYVIVGHDANIQLLKGEGHPMFPGTERRYIAGSIKYVHQALISSGDGWLDAEPEIELIRPDVYAVNEDGDRPEKRDYCAAHGIEYSRAQADSQRRTAATTKHRFARVLTPCIASPFVRLLFFGFCRHANLAFQILVADSDKRPRLPIGT